MPIISPQFSLQPFDRYPFPLDFRAPPVDFRAPPPSPTPGSRRCSGVANEDFLTEFLDSNLRVPDFILPGRAFPGQRVLRDEILAVDFGALDGSGPEIREALAGTGCFHVVNHGISSELFGSAARMAAGIFRLSPEKKRRAARSPEMLFGFEEESGEEREGVNEEFFWSGSCDLESKMEGVWPGGYSNFSEKMETLALAIEKVAKEIMLVIQEKSPPNTLNEYNNNQGGSLRCSQVHQKWQGCICHLYKHPHGVPLDHCISSLRYDVIRMMIRGPDYSHALALHICDGSSEFHLYSKKGWISFTPLPNALLLTAGDQLMAWSNGQFKNVIGRAIYTSKAEDCVSMTFLYSPLPVTIANNTGFQQQCKMEKIISLREQVLFALFFTIACQFFLYVYNKF